ncbi:MAG TPA: hypothetical protein VFB29_00280 [Pseudolabrys sp.]|nr:hypothetical protein [Pseudolabrys sp.]
MTALIKKLESIRDEYAHERNAYLAPPRGEANRYALLRDRAQEKVDALNLAICLLHGGANSEAA